MLTGSVAASLHGFGRATMDVDLVIDPTTQQLRSFVAGIEKTGAYVSIDAALEALAHRTMFNVVDTESGWKVDLIVSKERQLEDVRSLLRIHGDNLDLAHLGQWVNALGLQAQWASTYL